MLLHQQEKADELIRNEATITIPPGGYVRLVRYSGSDASVVQAARTSYGPGTKTLREDRKLLKYLYDNGHTSPFEMVGMTFHMKIPVFVARQMVRHRTAKLNEMSARYTEVPDEFWHPHSIHEVRTQSTKNRQGSVEGHEISAELYNEWVAFAAQAYSLYKKLLDSGVCREQARTVLPVSMYTVWYWHMDLRNILNFFRQRLDSHAQKETRDVAEALAFFARAVAPETMEIAGLGQRPGSSFGDEE